MNGPAGAAPAYTPLAPPRHRPAAWGRLLFPGVVAMSMSVPALLMGALAFDMRADFDLTAGWIGAGVSLFYVFSTLATRAGMPLLHRFRPMTMTRAGIALGSVAVLAAAVVGTKEALLAMCALSGLGNGIATPAANMLIALTVPAHRQGLAFGLRVSAVPGSAGLVAVGAYVVAHSGLGWRGLLTAVAACLVVVLLASLLAASPRVPRRPDATDGDADGGLVALRLLALGGLLAATACSVLSPFLVDGLIAGGASPGDAALLLGVSAWVGVAARITTGLAADRFPSPLRHVSSAAAMMVAAAVGMTGLAFGQGTAALATAALVTFGIGFAWPGLLHHSAITLHPEHMTRATSYMQLGTYVGALVGPLTFGLLVQFGSYRSAWLVTASVALLGALMLLAARRSQGDRVDARAAAA